MLVAQKEESEKKSRYKVNPRLQVYDEFGHESNEELMKELGKHKKIMRQNKKKSE